MTTRVDTQYRADNGLVEQLEEESKGDIGFGALVGDQMVFDNKGRNFGYHEQSTNLASSMKPSALPSSTWTN